MSLMRLAVLFLLPGRTPITWIDLTFGAALGGALLYYLNTPKIKEFFRPNNSARDGACAELWHKKEEEAR